MLNGLNTPRPGEHIYISGPELQGIYRVCTRKDVLSINYCFRLDVEPIYSDVIPDASITRKERSQRWQYHSREEDHELTILLPTAGRPVFISFKDKPDVPKSISGTVLWSRLDEKRFYSFMLEFVDFHQEKTYFLSQSRLTLEWDEKAREWFTYTYRQGRDGKLKGKKTFVEVCFA